MLSFRRQSSGNRSAAFAALALAAVILGACTMPANGGFNQARPDATPYAQANNRCWEQAYGTPSGGGSSQFGSAMSRYDACMAQAGWERGKSMF